MLKAPFILLVDDDLDDQELFGDALHEVEPSALLETADDGIDAFEKLNSFHGLPDLIFLDLNMPRLDGKGFLKQMKSRREFEPVPVIIYTTSSNPEEMRLTMEMGASQFMVKHDSFQDLCKALKDILARQNLVD